MSYYTYVPAKAAAPTPKYYYDYSKPAAPTPAPVPDPAKPIPSPLQHAYIQCPQVTAITHPYHPTYASHPHIHYPAPVPAPAPAPAAAAPAPTAPAPVHNPWPGKTRSEIDSENLAIASRIGATKPVQLVPYDASAEQQFWCRELDTSYTLRTAKDITENLQPGFWQYAQGGYPYWVRMEKT